METKSKTMGLDTTHNAWHGSYSSFMSWRIEVAKKSMGISLRDMVGFGGEVEWSEENMQHPLYELLNHSDCDGEIDWRLCKDISNALYELAPQIEDGRERWHTLQFSKGAMLAYNQKQNIEFA